MKRLVAWRRRREALRLRDGLVQSPRQIACDFRVLGPADERQRGILRSRLAEDQSLHFEAVWDASSSASMAGSDRATLRGERSIRPLLSRIQAAPERRNRDTLRQHSVTLPLDRHGN